MYERRPQSGIEMLLPLRCPYCDRLSGPDSAGKRHYCFVHRPEIRIEQGSRLVRVCTFVVVAVILVVLLMAAVTGAGYIVSQLQQGTAP